MSTIFLSQKQCNHYCGLLKRIKFMPYCLYCEESCLFLKEWTSHLQVFNDVYSLYHLELMSITIFCLYEACILCVFSSNEDLHS